MPFATIMKMPLAKGLQTVAVGCTEPLVTSNCPRFLGNLLHSGVLCETLSMPGVQLPLRQQCHYRKSLQNRLLASDADDQPAAQQASGQIRNRPPLPCFKSNSSISAIHQAVVTD